MKKYLFSAITAISLAALSALGGQAQAANLTVKSDASSATTLYVGSARWLDLTPGAQTMTLANGTVFNIRIAAADVTLLTQSSDFQHDFTNISGNVYFNSRDNLYGTTFTWCSAGNTTVQAIGGGQVLSDNCALANTMYSGAK